jgi:predicted RNA-binding protein YlxR (DUF448 family)
MLATPTAPTDDETDDGPKGRRGVPTRTCIVTRESGDPAQMLRFVIAPNGAVVADIKGELPGRGAWVGASRELLQKAVAKKAFARAFKRDVTVASDFPEQVERLLSERALASLALANKAGLVITGFDTVEKALGSQRVAGLFHAADASPDGMRKLFGAALRRYGDVAKIPPRWTFFKSSQLDLALGRQNVIHAALLEGPAAGAFAQRCIVLDRFLGIASSRDTDQTLAEPVTSTAI